MWVYTLDTVLKSPPKIQACVVFPISLESENGSVQSVDMYPFKIREWFSSMGGTVLYFLIPSKPETSSIQLVENIF